MDEARISNLEDVSYLSPAILTVNGVEYAVMAHYSLESNFADVHVGSGALYSTQATVDHTLVIAQRPGESLTAPLLGGEFSLRMRGGETFLVGLSAPRLYRYVVGTMICNDTPATFEMRTYGFTTF